MSLRSKILLKDVALLASLSLMIAGSLWGLLRQRQHVQGSLNEYAVLQRVEAAQTHLVAFGQSLHERQFNDPAAIADLRAASAAMREYKALLSQYNSILPPEITPDMQFQAREKTNKLVTALVKMALRIDPPKNHPQNEPIDPVAMSATVDQLSRDMADLLSICNGFVHRTQMESDKDLRGAIIAVSSVAALTLVTAVLASLWQYRRIMLPLNRLRQWCRQIIAGDFSIKYQATSDREFRELARDVNQMAAELEAFARKMESMVESKSRQLVRSERLASVGYLAAGVAHEINNPLNIMSGYAELTIKRLRRLRDEFNTAAAQPTPALRYSAEPDSLASDPALRSTSEPASGVMKALLSCADSDMQVIEHLSIIRSEAFRCKEITAKLLCLAKGTGDARETISLSDAVLEVVTLVRGLKGMQNKQLTVSIPSNEPLAVLANLTEIKQVLLNLVINAIEAVADHTGKISIDGRRAGDWIELTVSDNGRGMSAQTLDRIFEPFFTNKRGAGDPGTGLGLSITHAIIAHHGGEISAASDGPNRGSRFVVRMPAATAWRITVPAARDEQIPVVSP